MKQRSNPLIITAATPVREAVAQLASEGIVDLVPRLGAVVRSLNPISAREFYEVREVWSRLLPSRLRSASRPAIWSSSTNTTTS